MAATKRESGRQRGRATRSDILEVARRLFSEHGYHNTAVADIQQATGLTKGAFYHHFRSKEKLALAVLETAQSAYDEQLIEPAMKRASPAERIAGLLDGAIELNARPEWCNCQMMVTLGAELTANDGPLREAVQAMQISFFELWRDLIDQARQAGQINARIDPPTAAQWIMNTMAGLLLARKLGTAQVPPDKLIELMKQRLLGKPSRPRAPDRAQDE